MNQNIKLAVDAVVFGYEKQDLKVLLIRQGFGLLKQQWALVGGLVRDDESLIDAVKREIREEASVTVQYLEQLYTFGDIIDRDHRGRVVSVSYVALVNSLDYTLSAGSDAEDVGWFSLSEVPSLAFDHNKILEVALERLRSKLRYQPIGFDLLPPKFLFSELEQLYSIILEKKIDRRNFRKKILGLGFVEETEESVRLLAGRPARLFQFNKDKYNEFLSTGFHLEIKFV